MSDRQIQHNVPRQDRSDHHGSFHLLSLIHIYIINNACKYNNKAKGKVGITLTEYDRKVQVAIKDNGIGISKEDLPHIFRRTYRADMSRNSAGGSGLGLSICKKIIEEHGGEIWAESKLRAGTTIFFTLNKVIDQSKEK